MKSHDGSSNLCRKHLYRTNYYTCLALQGISVLADSSPATTDPSSPLCPPGPRRSQPPRRRPYPRLSHSTGSLASAAGGVAMEDYPEELRTPPLSLVSIVGCPELHPSISAALSSQQPPMNTLALPDFAKASILARSAKARDPLAPPQAPAGILKKDWLLKHRTRVPAAVAALFHADQVSGDPAQWLQACSDLENLKYVI